MLLKNINNSLLQCFIVKKFVLFERSLTHAYKSETILIHKYIY